jgi:hypothetical protein
LQKIFLPADDFLTSNQRYVKESTPMHFTQLQEGFHALSPKNGTGQDSRLFGVMPVK